MINLQYNSFPRRENQYFFNLLSEAFLYISPSKWTVSAFTSYKSSSWTGCWGPFTSSLGAAGPPASFYNNDEAAGFSVFFESKRTAIIGPVGPSS